MTDAWLWKLWLA